MVKKAAEYYLENKDILKENAKKKKRTETCLKKKKKQNECMEEIGIEKKKSKIIY